MLTTGDRITGPFGEATVSRAEQADVPGVLAVFDSAVSWLTRKGLSGQWGTTPFSAIPNMHKQFVDWIAASTLFVARIDGAVAGTMVITDDVPSYAEHMWGRFPDTALYIEAFATARSLEGLGLGRALLQWAEEYANRNGKSELWLDCWADNPDLCNYYTRAGYNARGLLVVNQWHARLFEKQISHVQAERVLQNSPSRIGNR
jgi:GNAT superfamily N-acetyltransferase